MLDHANDNAIPYRLIVVEGRRARRGGYRAGPIADDLNKPRRNAVHESRS
jgi:hypothetical protein